MKQPMEDPIAKKLRSLAAELIRMAEVMSAQVAEPIKLGSAVYERARGVLMIKKRVIVLTRTQAAILDAFLANRGALVTKDDLLECLYGEAAAQIVTRTLDTKVYELRKMLGVKSIETVHGRGWILK